MRLAFAYLALSALLLSGCSNGVAPPPLPDQSGTATQHTRSERLSSIESWAFAIGHDLTTGDPIARLSLYDLVVVDGQETSPELVNELQDTGTLVFGYVSVGTDEPQRPWSPYLEQYRLDYWGDWDEYFLDVADPACREAIIEHVVEPVLSKEFDGLFLDNTDMVETHPEQAEGMRALVAEIDELLDSEQLLFTQNGSDSIDELLPYLDGWNREDVTWTYDFDAEKYRRVAEQEHAAALEEIAAMQDAGVLVLSTDYTTGDPEIDAECAEAARAVGALPYVSDIGLERLGGPW